MGLTISLIVFAVSFRLLFDELARRKRARQLAGNPFYDQQMKTHLEQLNNTYCRALYGYLMIVACLLYYAHNT